MPMISLQAFSIGTPVGNGSSGSLLFVSSAGLAAQDNGNLNFNDTLNTLNVNNIYSSGTSTLNSVAISNSGIIPTANGSSILGSPGFRFANAWVNTISGVDLQSSTANTPALGSNNTKLATTAFVVQYVSASGGSGGGGGGDVYLANANTFTNVNTFRDVRFSVNDTYLIGTTTTRPSGIFVGSSGINSIGTITGSGNINSSSVTINGQTLTGSGTGSMLIMNQEWNTSATPTAFEVNITDTASNANSKAIVVKTDGFNRFAISKYGEFTASNNIGESIVYNFTGITSNTSLGFIIKEIGGTYLRLSAPGHLALQINETSYILMDSLALHPYVNNTMTIGTPSEVFNNGYFTGLNIGASGLLSIGDITSSGTIRGFANLTGNSTATTQTVGTNNTTIATTAFVTSYVAASGGAGGGGDVYLANANTFTNTNTFRDIRFSANNTYNIGTTTSRPSGLFIGASGINSIGNITSSGNMFSATPATAENSTMLATTAYVQTNLAAYLPQTSGTILATLTSPLFTGDPRGPTPSGADSDTSLATTDFVKIAASGARTGSIGFAFPSGTLVAGATTLSILCPTGRTIRGITLLAEGSGSCSIDIRKIAYGSYPIGSANTIFTGSNRATIVSGVKSRDTTLSTLISTSINRFDTLQASVTSVTGITGITAIMDTFVE